MAPHCPAPEPAPPCSENTASSTPETFVAEHTVTGVRTPLSLPAALPDGTNPFRVLDWDLYTGYVAARHLADARQKRFEALGRKFRTEDRNGTLYFHRDDDPERGGVESALSVRTRLTWSSAIRDARRLCARFGIPFEAYDPVLKAAQAEWENVWQFVWGNVVARGVDFYTETGRRLCELADSTTTEPLPTSLRAPRAADPRAGTGEGEMSAVAAPQPREVESDGSNRPDRQPDRLSVLALDRIDRTLSNLLIRLSAEESEEDDAPRKDLRKNRLAGIRVEDFQRDIFAAGSECARAEIPFTEFDPVLDRAGCSFHALCRAVPRGTPGQRAEYDRACGEARDVISRLARFKSVAMTSLLPPPASGGGPAQAGPTLATTRDELRRALHLCRSAIDNLTRGQLYGSDLAPGPGEINRLALEVFGRPVFRETTEEIGSTQGSLWLDYPSAGRAVLLLDSRHVNAFGDAARREAVAALTAWIEETATSKAAADAVSINAPSAGAGQGERGTYADPFPGGKGEGGRGRKKTGRPPIGTSKNDPHRLIKRQVYERVWGEKQPGVGAKAILDLLRSDRQFVEQVREAGLKLDSKLIRRAIAADPAKNSQSGNQERQSENVS